MTENITLSAATTEKDSEPTAKAMLWRAIEHYRLADSTEEHIEQKEVLDNYIDDMLDIVDGDIERRVAAQAGTKTVDRNIRVTDAVEPFKPLSDDEILWIAKSHGIDVYACNVLGFYTDLISTSPVQAAVEPVPDDIVAGALYDFLGYLTSRRTRITMSDRDDAGAAVDALVDWSKTRKINLTEARVRDWNTYTSPPDALKFRPDWSGVEVLAEELREAQKAMRLALEALKYATKQVPELGTVPGIEAAIAALEKQIEGPTP